MRDHVKWTTPLSAMWVCAGSKGMVFNFQSNVGQKIGASLLWLWIMYDFQKNHDGRARLEEQMCHFNSIHCNAEH